LIGVGHDAGVAQRGAFDGVLARECRTKQQHALIRNLAVGIQSVGEFVGVPPECTREVAVTAAEASLDIIQGRFDVVVGEGEDAREHDSRPRLLQLETLLAWDEEPGDHPRRVGCDPLRAARD
jgi:hypothetical protein